MFGLCNTDMVFINKDISQVRIGEVNMEQIRKSIIGKKTNRNNPRYNTLESEDLHFI